MTTRQTSSAGARRTRSRSQTKVPALSDLDLRILGLLTNHRVLTQNQLAAINPETPARTLRYRCARLARLGLAGRTRPYRERGSAPHHLWPTRKGEALACGGPPPRGGERREPNPLFLAHAAGLSEIYVALATTLPAEVTLARFEREADAREPFETLRRDKRAVAPDVFIEISDLDDRALLAFIELDMGTMSHRRLRQKAAGYAEYAKAAAWRENHRLCPALLFLTTTEQRARSFLSAMQKELERDTLLLTCASDLAQTIERCATERRWLLGPEDEEAVDLLAALREARRPFDEARERRAARRREEDDERELLRTDPEALRDHLRRWRHRDWGMRRLGEPAATALVLTLDSEDELADPQRRALLALGGIFADPLDLQLADRELSAGERRAFDGLIDQCRAEQLDWIGDLAEQFGEGPALRKARRKLEAVELLLDKADVSQLKLGAADDERSRGEQERLHRAYLELREEEAHRLAKAQGIAGRLRNGPETFLAEVDRRSLRLCPSCEEIAYPDPQRARYERARPDVAFSCHFCGGSTLAKLDEDGSRPWSRSRNAQRRSEVRRAPIASGSARRS
ncbi:MAG: replication-relaxation family protein [Solirubrobacterales bacterium]